MAIERILPRRQNMITLTAAFSIFAGGALGFVWHKLVGCRTGACPITANPYISTLYGAFIGFMTVGGK